MRPTLTHIALHVADLDACIAFYRDFCALQVIHERPGKGQRIVWMAEPGREHSLVFVLMPGGSRVGVSRKILDDTLRRKLSRAAVDAIAARGRAAGCLLWEPREEPFPVGYYCGLRDPAGNYVEFSYGQPLGPGSEAMPIP